MKRTILQKAAAAALFMLLTAALLAAADFLLVDDVHSYSRVMLQELYADAGNIDTLFLGSSHCYRSVDPAQVDAALGTHSFNAGSSQQLPDGSYYMLKEAAAQNPLKTVYLETFYTGYNQQKSSNVPLACYLITDYMRASSPYRYQYLWEMGGAAAFADLVFPARHAIADPGELPALWRGKLTGGYNAGNYDWVTYPDARGCQRADLTVWPGEPDPHCRVLQKAEHPPGAGHRPAAQRLCAGYPELPGLCGCHAQLCRGQRHPVLGFFAL